MSELQVELLIALDRVLRSTMVQLAGEQSHPRFNSDESDDYIADCKRRVALLSATRSALELNFSGAIL